MLLSQQFDCEGYDGNPATPVLSDGICGVMDLSAPFDLSKKFDWVLSLEVGEHLPKKFEKTFVENLDRHNTSGIVLSWAIPGQGGTGHFNEQNNGYVQQILIRLGYVPDRVVEQRLRKVASIRWFKNTIMVFRKI